MIQAVIYRPIAGVCEAVRYGMDVLGKLIQKILRAVSEFFSSKPKMRVHRLHVPPPAPRGPSPTGSEVSEAESFLPGPDSVAQSVTLSRLFPPSPDPQGRPFPTKLSPIRSSGTLEIPRLLGSAVLSSPIDVGMSLPHGSNFSLRCTVRALGVYLSGQNLDSDALADILKQEIAEKDGAIEQVLSAHLPHSDWMVFKDSEDAIGVRNVCSQVNELWPHLLECCGLKGYAGAVFEKNVSTESRTLEKELREYVSILVVKDRDLVSYLAFELKITKPDIRPLEKRMNRSFYDKEIPPIKASLSLTTSHKPPEIEAKSLVLVAKITPLML